MGAKQGGCVFARTLVAANGDDGGAIVMMEKDAKEAGGTGVQSLRAHGSRHIYNARG